MVDLQSDLEGWQRVAPIAPAGGHQSQVTGDVGQEALAPQLPSDAERLLVRDPGADLVASDSRQLAADVLEEAVGIGIADLAHELDGLIRQRARLGNLANLALHKRPIAACQGAQASVVQTLGKLGQRVRESLHGRDVSLEKRGPARPVEALAEESLVPRRAAQGHRFLVGSA